MRGCFLQRRVKAGQALFHLAVEPVCAFTRVREGLPVLELSLGELLPERGEASFELHDFSPMAAPGAFCPEREEHSHDLEGL